MASSARTLRKDSVEIYPDNAGRLPNFVKAKQRGALLLTVADGQHSVTLLRDGLPSWEGRLATVRFFGSPRGPFGSASLGERAVRLGVGEDRVIVAFTGETADLSSSLTDLQTSRLTGEVDLLAISSSVRALWRNRKAWRRSLEAANAWRDLLTADERPSPAARRISSQRGTRGSTGARARYSDEFRRRAVAAADASEKPVAAVARELQISPTTLHRWIRDSSSEGKAPNG